MRVGIDAVPFAFEQAGIGRYLGSMLEEMQAADPSIEFLLYSPWPIDVPMRKGNWHLRIASGRLARRPSLWVQTKLPGMLAADKVDAFWGQPTNLPIRIKRACFRILTIHDLVPYVRPESMRLRSLLRMRLILGPVARAADALVADSEATAASACRYLGIRRERVSIVYAAAQSVFRQIPRGEAGAAVAERFGLSGGYVLCVSTIEPRKDHLTLLRAMESMSGAPLLVLAGGVGWRCRSIVEQIRAQEDGGRVRYLGRVEDESLVALYNAARLSVYPSLYEGFGLPVLESMACGCPVLCSDSSSLPEVGGDSARYFRTGDDVSLCAELRRLLGSQSELESMSKSGLARAGMFSFRRAAEQLLDVIRGGVKRLHTGRGPASGTRPDHRRR